MASSHPNASLWQIQWMLIRAGLSFFNLLATPVLSPIITAAPSDEKPASLATSNPPPLLPVLSLILCVLFQHLQSLTFLIHPLWQDSLWPLFVHQNKKLNKHNHFTVMSVKSSIKIPKQLAFCTFSDRLSPIVSPMVRNISCSEP